MTEAIQACDIVLAFYRERAGSRFLDGEPFHGTDFELAQARKLRKPVYLYLLGNQRKPRLQQVLSIFTNPRIFPETVKSFDDEKDLLEAVSADVAKAAMEWMNYLPGRLIVINPIIISGNLLLEEAYDVLARLIAEERYSLARSLVNRFPRLGGASPGRDDRIAYARLLGAYANVWADQMEYELATRAATRSVRIYMEIGYWNDMFAQIQALSGILNMARHTREAEAVNAYGIRAAARNFPDLLPAFHDSRGSILARLGRGHSARSRLWKSLGSQKEPSGYSLSKYASALAYSGKLQDIAVAERLVREDALRAVRVTGKSESYVLKEAAGLAFLDGEYAVATHDGLQAERICVEHGLHHTLVAVRRMNALARLVTEHDLALPSQTRTFLWSAWRHET